MVRPSPVDGDSRHSSRSAIIRHKSIKKEEKRNLTSCAHAKTLSNGLVHNLNNNNLNFHLVESHDICDFAESFSADKIIYASGLTEFDNVLCEIWRNERKKSPVCGFPINSPQSSRDSSNVGHSASPAQW